MGKAQDATTSCESDKRFFEADKAGYSVKSS